LNPQTAYWLQQALNALQLGSIYALIALGYSMVYGTLSMINFAHGDVFMVGAFLCFLAGTALGLPFAPTLLLAMCGAALLGVAIERLAYKPLRNAPRVSAIITALGVGLFLENLMLAFYPYPQNVPRLLENVTWHLGGVSISSLQVVIIGLSLALMLVLDHVVHRTPVGMAMRAISWDKSYVPLMGISVNLIISITFAIGAGLAGAAGTMYGLAYPVIDPYLGILIGWKAFMAAVVGGIGNVRGAMIGAFILGGVEIMVVALLPSTYRDLVVFSLLLALIIVRPHGILGQPRVQKV
jgi:branched-chain amino acid transport system permease protein